MSEARLTNSVYYKSSHGQFLRKYEDKKRRAIAETVEEGARIARSLATRKTGRMAASISTTTGTSGGTWSVGTEHWQFQEFGTRPHFITGDVSFFWAREGRRWIRGTNFIHHPGNRAVFFMKRSYDLAAPTLLARMARL